MSVEIKTWGRTPKGFDVELITLTNTQGNSVSFTTLGATWVSAIVPDKNGEKTDVVLGFPTLKGHLSDTCYMGTTVGRFANRIGKAQFTIDGETYKLAANVGEHILHGGIEGFDKRVWAYKTTDNSVQFSLTSPDGDQGFPGTLQANVTYTWNNNNKLTIHFGATTDKPTHVSLTNHAYFNLAGKGDINNQVLKINSDTYLPMGEGSIVLGERRLVKNTPFDFTTAKPIGQDIEADDDQIVLARGFDHTFVLKKENTPDLILAAEANDPVSGRAMKMYTSYSSVHMYAANFLESTENGKNGKPYQVREAFCLEAQFAPNTPNLPDFPSSLLHPGENYDYKIVVEFGTL